MQSRRYMQAVYLYPRGLKSQVTKATGNGRGSLKHLYLNTSSRSSVHGSSSSSSCHGAAVPSAGPCHAPHGAFSLSRRARLRGGLREHRLQPWPHPQGPSGGARRGPRRDPHGLVPGRHGPRRRPRRHRQAGRGPAGRHARRPRGDDQSQQHPVGGRRRVHELRAGARRHGRRPRRLVLDFLRRRARAPAAHPQDHRGRLPRRKWERDAERDDPAEPRDAARRSGQRALGKAERLARGAERDDEEPGQYQLSNTARRRRRRHRLQHVPGDRARGAGPRPERAAHRPAGGGCGVEVGRPVLAGGRDLPGVARRAGPRLGHLPRVRKLHRPRRGAAPGARRRAGAHRPTLPVGGPAELRRRRPRRALAGRAQAARRRRREGDGRRLGSPAAGAVAPVGRLLRVALRVELDDGGGAARRAVPVLALLRRPVLQPELRLRRVGHGRGAPRRRARGGRQGGDQEQGGAAARRRGD